LQQSKTQITMKKSFQIIIFSFFITNFIYGFNTTPFSTLKVNDSIKEINERKLALSTCSCLAKQKLFFYNEKDVLNCLNDVEKNNQSLAKNANLSNFLTYLDDYCLYISNDFKEDYHTEKIFKSYAGLMSVEKKNSEKKSEKQIIVEKTSEAPVIAETTKENSLSNKPKSIYDYKDESNLKQTIIKSKPKKINTISELTYYKKSSLSEENLEIEGRFQKIKYANFTTVRIKFGDKTYEDFFIISEIPGIDLFESKELKKNDLVRISFSKQVFINGRDNKGTKTKSINVAKSIEKLN